MTKLEIRRSALSLFPAFGNLFGNPQRIHKRHGAPDNRLSEANRYETQYDEAKPFFMQQNWRG